MINPIIRPPKLYRLLYPEAVWRIDTQGARRVFLTFDDGPVPSQTPWVLDVLEKYGIKATFFMVGDNIRRNAALLREVRAAGHEVGNHTMHHMQGLKNSLKDYLDDITRAQDLIGETALFRAPHGFMRPSQYKAIKQTHTIVMHDLVTRDYSSKLTAGEVFDNVRKYAREGSIIVFHDSDKASARMRHALPQSIEWLLDNGFDFATIPSRGFDPVD